MQTLKVQVRENTRPGGNRQPGSKVVRSFTVTGDSYEGMRRQALRLVDSGGAAKSAQFATLGAGNRPDAIVVSYYPEAAAS